MNYGIPYAILKATLLIQHNLWYMYLIIINKLTIKIKTKGKAMFVILPTKV